MAGWLAGLVARWVRIVGATATMCAVVLGAPAAVSASESASAPAGGGLAGSLLESSPLIEPLGAGQAAEEAALARLSSPEALAEDAKSRMQFAGYGRAAAVALAKRVFGFGGSQGDVLLGQGAGEITGYVGERGAVETLPDGKRVLLESSVPLRSSLGSGHLAPVSLALSAGESGYMPANPLVPVVISKSAAEGVAFQFGLRVKPTQDEAPEASEMVGDSVFYPGTAKDTDFMLEPALDGVEASWQILSAEGSSENALSFTLPAGASLVLSHSVEGAAEVLLEGRRLMLVMPATAMEANGASLPVSYSVSGDTLVSHVDLSGNVAFPVMVDPLITQEYGGSGNFWEGWQFTGEGSIYYEGGQGSTGILGGIHTNSIPKSYAAWGVFAPGWSAGEGSITRVNVTGLTHQVSGKSNIETGIVNGKSPVWTYKPTNASETKSGLLLTNEGFTGRSASFCAVGAGGYDGGQTPLCNESEGGQYFRLTVDTGATQQSSQYDVVEANSVRYLDTSKMTASASSATEVGGQPNVLYGGEKWLGPHSGALEEIAGDPAFGVANLSLLLSKSGVWETVASKKYQTEGICKGIICGLEQHQVVNYQNLTAELPNGNNTVKVEASDASGVAASSTYTLHVDHTAPHGLTVSGAHVKGGKENEPEGEIDITEGPVADQVTVEASDGENGVPSSGIREFGLEVDEHRLTAAEGQGQNQGSCAPGPCSARETWTLNGRELGAGYHTLTVTATDNAGNIEAKTYQLTVYAASPVAMGPGSVNPQSGDFALESTDVNLKDGAGALTLTRHFDSRNPNEGGTESPLGPQWTIGLGALASLEVLGENEGKNDGVVVTGPDGVTFFKPTGNGGFTPPPEDANGQLSLKFLSNGGEYVLENRSKGTSTSFTHPKGAKEWIPTAARGTVSTDTLTDTYKSVELPQKGGTIVEPMEELAPHSSKLSCPAEIKAMERGCRALLFSYGNEHTEQPEASGEGESQWGWYRNRLTKVAAVAWNSSTKEMQEVAVAEYSYDGNGRLRAEWDPRIKPALKTIYGYDSEGHVAAVSAPGQQPWLMTYGTTAEDPSAGRLIKVKRPSASTALWAGQAPESKEAPAISGTLVVGNHLAASVGEWSHSQTYGFQWEDCAPGQNGLKCSPIAGAVNANYTPTTKDVGQKLEVEVTAGNAGGSTLASSVVSAEVLATSETKTEGAQQPLQAGSTIEYNVPVSGAGAPYAMGPKEVEAWGQKDVPVEAAAVFPPEHPQGWPASSYTGATVSYTDEYARTVNVANPSGGISTSEYNKEGDVERTLSADNRAKALKEANPAEAAKKLDTESKYSGSGSELTEVTGPEHQVKLANGETVQARNHVRYFYDEGAPEGEEYGLLTKTIDGALLSNGEEKDLRTATTSYSGQEGVGWKLRMPTSTTNEPAGVDLTHATVYDKETGTVVETKSPGGTSEAVYPPAASSTFGGEGTGNGQFKAPKAVAIDSSGHVWVADTNNNRIEEFSSSGSFMAAYGSAGSGNGQFSKPSGIAVTGNQGNIRVYVADAGNKRVEELNGQGEYLAQWNSWRNGQNQLENLEEPNSVTVDAAGHVWVSDGKRNQVLEFSGTGEFIRSFGVWGTGNGQFKGPGQIAFSGGMLYVVDQGNKRVQEFTPTGTYTAQFGVKGTGPGQMEGPWGIATAPVTGDLYVCDEWEARVLQFSPAGKFLAEFGTWGAGKDGLEGPTGIAVNATGTVYVAAATNNRVSVWTPAGAGGSNMFYTRAFGSEGWKEGQFYWPAATSIDGHGNVWATDTGNDRIQEFNPRGGYLTSCGSAGTGNGQFKDPTGIVVNQSTGDMYVADHENDRIQELGPKCEFVRAFGSLGTEPGQLSHPGGLALDAAGNVWVSDTGNNRIQKFSSTGSFIAAYGKSGTGNLQFKEPDGLAFSGENLYVVDSGNDRVQELNGKGEYVSQWGSEGSRSGEFSNPKGIAADPAGNLYISDSNNGRVEEFNPQGGFLASFGAKGKGEAQSTWPEGLAINAAGALYVADSGDDRIQEWTPDRQAVHDIKTIYYTPGTEASIPACQNHPEWEGLPCRTEHAAQPETEGLPALPYTTIEYNMWDQPEKTTETFGSTTRTTTMTFEGERPTSQALSAGADVAVPTASEKYSTTTGALLEQSTETEGKTETVSRAYNTLGELESYTDADGNLTTYTYDEYARLTEINFDQTKLDGMQASQHYSYNETTGALSELEDSATKTFKASYDVEGNLTSETYPNGMTATYAYNSIGEATSLSYEKNNHCTGAECKWFTDSITPSIHGEALLQESSLATDRYAFDNVGRLSEVQETPAGEGCTTRIYAYNEESSRTSLTSRKPGTEGKCATEGGEIERHAYDEGNRLTDESIKYDALDNVTKLPATDAGGSEITSEYYADGQARTQTQAEKTNTYLLDPEDRTRRTETVTKGVETTVTISHYADSGSTPSWTYNQTTGAWTRLIAGIGGLTAVQESGKQAVLQLRDLQGNIIGTASLNETTGKPETLERTTEYGVPVSGKPADRYGWLGASGLSAETSNGTIIQDGSTYVPQLGAPLQTEGTEVPAAPTTATPGVITVPPPQIFKDEEAKSKAEEGETPTGDVPGPEGEEREGTRGIIYRIEVGSAGTEATAAYYRKFILTPGEALDAARAITAIHHGIINAPFFPQWANIILHHMPGFDWDKLAEDLDKAAAAVAEDDGLDVVEVSIQGSVRPKHFHLLVLVEAVVL